MKNGHHYFAVSLLYELAAYFAEISGFATLTPMATGLQQDAYGNCRETYVFEGNWSWLNGPSCTPESAQEYKDKQDALKDLSSGDDKTKNAAAIKLSEIALNEAARVARIRLGSDAAKDIEAIRKLLNEGDFSAAARLNYAINLRVFVEVGTPSEVRGRLHVAGVQANKFLRNLHSFKNQRLITPGPIGGIFDEPNGKPNRSMAELYLQFASGMRDTVDDGQALDPWMEFGPELANALATAFLIDTGLILLRGVGGLAAKYAGGKLAPWLNRMGQAFQKGFKGFCNSFTPDTKVLTKSGLAAIATLAVGSKVMAFNESTGKQGEFEITAVHKNNDPQITKLSLETISTDDAKTYGSIFQKLSSNLKSWTGQAKQNKLETITTTPEHPFFVEKASSNSQRPKPQGHDDLSNYWVGAGHLLEGDLVKRANGGFGVVKSVVTLEQSRVMYNLTVDEAHTFFVGDGQYLVHNCDVSFDPTQLQKKFKHAVDFGVPGNYNKQAGGVFQQALEKHVTDPNTVVINGTYLGNPVKHYFNPVTGNNVMANPAGEFISGWTLSPAQRQYVLTTGNIGGHK